ncbi:unnamed protein product [Protopolystoma xenopodis]|uniref:Uncharacterized protein n=1 Tax=Protopolystoma xenopodis TaxID=117903 RepID=A0A448WWF9_9PLAT|nr:unnamed protein product [Protopolystoma xenopodis]
MQPWLRMGVECRAIASAFNNESQRPGLPTGAFLSLRITLDERCLRLQIAGAGLEVGLEVGAEVGLEVGAVVGAEVGFKVRVGVAGASVALPVAMSISGQLTSRTARQTCCPHSCLRLRFCSFTGRNHGTPTTIGRPTRHAKDTLNSGQPLCGLSYMCMRVCMFVCIAYEQMGRKLKAFRGEMKPTSNLWSQAGQMSRSPLVGIKIGLITNTIILPNRPTFNHAIIIADSRSSVASPCLYCSL